MTVPPSLSIPPPNSPASLLETEDESFSVTVPFSQEEMPPRQPEGGGRLRVLQRLPERLPPAGGLSENPCRLAGGGTQGAPLMLQPSLGLVRARDEDPLQQIPPIQLQRSRPSARRNGFLESGDVAPDCRR